MTTNPFLVQRQITAILRSLPKTRKRMVAQAILFCVNDARYMTTSEFANKYLKDVYVD